MLNVRNIKLCLSLISSLIFMSLSSLILLKGHIHEDAYILFTYAENLVNHSFIGYSLGTGPAEGATDFLWMIILSGLNFLGLDIGWAAAVLNGIGIFLIVYILCQVSFKYTNNPAFAIILTLFVPISYLAQGAMVGFSTAFYSSLILIYFYFLIYSNDRWIVFAPAIGLLLALVRPDGAIFGVLGSMVFLFAVRKNDRSKYLLAVLITGAIGIFYFVARWNYFGEFLPLPLIVKSSSDLFLPGATTNLLFVDSIYLLCLFGVFGVITLQAGIARKLSVVLPAAVYFLSITFAEQTQNMGLRFQAPLLVAILLFSVIFVSQLHTFFFDRLKSVKQVPIFDRLKSVKQAPIFFILFIVIALAPIGLKNANSVRKILNFMTNSEYFQYFPYYLANYVDDNTVIALTEAGGLAYWMPGKKYDLVGLNTAETAVAGASSGYIEEISPDLIMAHHGGLLGNLQCSTGTSFCELARDQLVKAASENNSHTYLESEIRVLRAAAVTVEFLSNNYDDYSVISVKYGPSNVHIYGIRKNGAISVRDFMSALQESHTPEQQLSYYEMKTSID